MRLRDVIEWVLLGAIWGGAFLFTKVAVKEGELAASAPGRLEGGGDAELRHVGVDAHGRAGLGLIVDTSDEKSTNTSRGRPARAAFSASVPSTFGRNTTAAASGVRSVVRVMRTALRMRSRFDSEHHYFARLEILHAATRQATKRTAAAPVP